MYKYIRSDRRQIKELRKQQAQWEARYNERVAEYNQQKSQFFHAIDVWRVATQDDVRAAFQQYFDKVGNATVDIGIGYPFFNSSEGGVSITVTCGSGDLAGELWSPWWQYTVGMTDAGRIMDKTVHYENLDSATPEDAEFIKASAELLKAMTTYDWNSLLSICLHGLPKDTDYCTIENPMFDPEYQDPGFREQIVESALKDFVGKDIWLSVGTTYWVKLLRYAPDTDKYTVSMVELADLQPQGGVPVNTKKQMYNKILNPSDTTRVFSSARLRLYAKYPFEIVTTDELLELVDLTAENYGVTT